MRKKYVRGTLPRYVQAYTNANGDIQYRFNPPQNLINEGVVPRENLGTDLRSVRPLASELNKAIDEYRNRNRKVLQKSSTLNELVDVYFKSNDFQMLKEESQVDYKYFLATLTSDVGSAKYRELTSQRAKHLYEQWVKRGVQFANHVLTVSSKVYNFAIDMEYATSNPFKTVKRKKPQQRKVVWTQEDVVKFLDTAYSDFSYRSIGLIVHMAYEWCQRVGDMRVLTWDCIDLENRRLELEQSKRRALVYLPIEDDLHEMLMQQHNDYGFQKYVAPRPMPKDGGFHPYGMEHLSKVFRSCARLAGLSDEIRMQDLRRTGTTQMVEAGVPMPQIMAVTGHASPKSVMPYVKHTYMSANEALTTRKKSSA